MAANLTHITDKRTTPNTTYKFTPESTAEEFSTAKAYAVGDYCFYGGTLYKCIEDKAAGAWAAAKFEEAVVGDEINARIYFDSDGYICFKTGGIVNE